MSSITAKHLNLKQCLVIQANQYRSSDNRRDYQAEEIEERILELQANKSEREFKTALKALESVPVIEERLELVTEIKDYWKLYGPNGFSYELIEIPPQIMSF